MPGNIHTFERVLDIAEQRSYTEKNPDGSAKVIIPAARVQVRLEVDVESLMDTIGVRAAVNRSGKSVEAGGAVKAVRVKILGS